MSSERGLRILNPTNFIDSSNPFKIQTIHDASDPDMVLSKHPQYANMSYYSKGRRYKDFTSFLKKFRCKSCHAYGTMGGIIKDKARPNIIEALGCSNCGYIAMLEAPIDKNNLGATSTGMDKRPTLVGRSSKFKMPISEAEKLGISRALRKNLPPHLRNRNSKTALLDTSLQDNSPGNNLSKTIRKSLARAGFPLPSSHSNIKAHYDKADPGYDAFMQGKGIISEHTDYTRPDIQRRFNGLVNQLF